MNQKIENKLQLCTVMGHIKKLSGELRFAQIVTYREILRLIRMTFTYLSVLYLDLVALILWMVRVCQIDLLEHLNDCKTKIFVFIKRKEKKLWLYGYIKVLVPLTCQYSVGVSVLLQYQCCKDNIVAILQ